MRYLSLLLLSLASCTTSPLPSPQAYEETLAAFRPAPTQPKADPPIQRATYTALELKRPYQTLLDVPFTIRQESFSPDLGSVITDLLNLESLLGDTLSIGTEGIYLTLPIGDQWTLFGGYQELAIPGSKKQDIIGLTFRKTF